MLKYGKPVTDDLAQMTELYRVYLNGGDSIEEYVREGLEGGAYAGAKCEDGEKLIGIFTARPGVEFTCGHNELVEKIESGWTDGGIYTADMLVVLPEYRGLGVARQLAKNLRDDLVRQGARWLVIEEWRRRDENDVPVSGVIKYFGKPENLGYYPDFYKDMHKFGMTCPECGEICTCGALVCVIDLLGEEG